MWRLRGGTPLTAGAQSDRFADVVEVGGDARSISFPLGHAFDRCPIGAALAGGKRRGSIMPKRRRCLLGDGRRICLLNDRAERRHRDHMQGLSPGAVILGAIG
jgi:hypothetical protein